MLEILAGFYGILLFPWYIILVTIVVCGLGAFPPVLLRMFKDPPRILHSLRAR